MITNEHAENKTSELELSCNITLKDMFPLLDERYSSPPITTPTSCNSSPASCFQKRCHQSFAACSLHTAPFHVLDKFEKPVVNKVDQ